MSAIGCLRLFRLNYACISHGCVSCRVARNQYLNTHEFIDAVAEELKDKLWKKAKL